MSEHEPTANAALAHVETWIFDLDNTLYPARCRLFDQVDQRIGAFIADFLGVDRIEARRIQKAYFRSHDTTLNGLMADHDVDPEVFLEYVHDIDISSVARSEPLDAALEKISGRKLLFTNASAAHARKVMTRLGVERHFEGIFDIAAADYVPKPRPESYLRLIERHSIEPRKTVIIDDISHNLRPAAALGMVTVWVRTEEPWAQPENGADYLDHVADDLVSWLQAVAARG